MGSDGVLEGIRSISTVSPAVIYVASLIFILKYSLNNKNLERLRALKKDKEDGKEYDLEPIKELLS